MYDPYGDWITADASSTTPAVTDNDALGGAGSVKTALLGIALGGLSRAVDGAAAKKYPLTYFNEGEAINADGQRVPAGAPGKTVSAGQAAADALKNPLVIGIGVAVLAGVAIVWALRR